MAQNIKCAFSSGRWQPAARWEFLYEGDKLKQIPISYSGFIISSRNEADLRCAIYLGQTEIFCILSQLLPCLSLLWLLMMFGVLRTALRMVNCQVWCLLRYSCLFLEVDMPRQQQSYGEE